MNGIQLENGHTRIANALLEKLSKVGMGGNCWRVLIAIIRKLYGYGKKEDWIEYSQIMKITGMRKERVCESIKQLREIGIVTQKRNGIKQIIAINKDFSIVTQKRNSYGKPFSTVTENRTTKETITKEINSGIFKKKLPPSKIMNTYDENKFSDEYGVSEFDELGNSIKEVKEKKGMAGYRLDAENLLKYYTALYKKEVGDEVPYWPKSAYLRQVKPILAKYKVEKLKELLNSYFSRDDEITRGNKWSISCFLSWKMLNQLND